MLRIPVPPNCLCFIVENNNMCIYLEQSLKTNLLFIFNINFILFPFIKSKYIVYIFGYLSKEQIAITKCYIFKKHLGFKKCKVFMRNMA